MMEHYEAALEEVSEQDKTIASVVLAGWRIVPTPFGHNLSHRAYMITGPDGAPYGTASTRYTAACKAEALIWEGEKLEALMPRSA